MGLKIMLVQFSHIYLIVIRNNLGKIFRCFAFLFVKKESEKYQIAPKNTKLTSVHAPLSLEINTILCTSF